MHESRTAIRLPKPLLLAVVALGSMMTGCTAMRPPKAAAELPREPADSMVLRAGHIEEQPTAAGAGPVPAELTEPMEAYRREDFPKAEKLFRRIADDTRTDPLIAEKARFYQAECLRRQTYFPTAADAYNKMLMDFPAGVYREQAVQRMFDIANYWLNDTRAQMDMEQEKREGKRWFVPSNFFHWDRSKPFLDMEGRALQVLEQVHYNDPSGPCSDKALYLLGYVHFNRGNFKEADQFLSQLVEAHEKSPLRPKAIELGVMAKNNSTGGPLYDGRPSAEALKMLHEARGNTPELAGRAQFLDNQVVAIRMQQADKDFGIAEFYRKTGHSGSAYFYYELVRRRYPDTEHARRAAQRMNELHGQLEESRQGPGFWGSTRRGFNKYVLGQPDAELQPGQTVPQPPFVPNDANARPEVLPTSLPTDLKPRQ